MPCGPDLMETAEAPHTDNASFHGKAAVQPILHKLYSRLNPWPIRLPEEQSRVSSLAVISAAFSRQTENAIRRLNPELRICHQLPGAGCSPLHNACTFPELDSTCLLASNAHIQTVPAGYDLPARGPGKTHGNEDRQTLWQEKE